MGTRRYMSYSNYYTSSGLFHGSMSSVMGTQFDILMIGDEPAKLTVIWGKIQEEIKRLDKMLNRFDQESEVSKLNQIACIYPLVVSEELWRILQDCKCFFEWTKGYFDISLQGFEQILLNEDEHSAFFLSDLLKIDFGGYGKGYALSKVEALLKNNGIDKALVNFGNSSILAVGKHPCGDFWPVSLENPYTKSIVANVKLCDSSLSVSGNMPSQWKADRQHGFLRLYEALMEEYNPIHNYDKTIKSTTDYRGKETDDLTFSGSEQLAQQKGLNETTISKTPYDDTNFIPNTKSSNAMHTDTDTKSFTNRKNTNEKTFTNRQDEYNYHEYGNIGVTTTQQMITSQFPLTDLDALKRYIVNLFVHENLVL